uniref:Uncharacterized protein LOC108038421 n=1 Tax=Drosophila rhopaloa TaxID=1041015 RepID=A0A6P4E603_DRORH
MYRYLKDSGDNFGHLRPRLFNQKKQRSWDHGEFEDQAQDPFPISSCLDSQSSICSAENPNDVRYEKNHGCKSPKKVVKDEDDDEDADPAANSDDADMDNCKDDDEGDDESDQDGSEVSAGDEAFVARISCLLRALEQHTKSMADNLKTLQSRLAKSTKTQSTTCRKNNFGTLLSAHPKAKWSRKPMAFREPDQCAQDGMAPEVKVESLDHQPEALGINTADGEHRMLLPPLLKIIQSPAPQKSHLQSRQDITGSKYLLPTREVAGRIEAQSKSHFDEDTQLQYEEYEAKLRRLMANRDAIERKVKSLTAPQQGECI